MIHFISWLCAGAIMFSSVRSLKLCGFVMDLGGIHKSSLMCVLAVQATYMVTVYSSTITHMYPSYFDVYVHTYSYIVRMS